MVANPDIMLSRGGVRECDGSLCGNVELETETGEMYLVRDTERVLSEDRKPSDRN